jgi:hypothetical protein
MHAWQCRYCDGRNAPALARCHQCGADAGTGSAVMPAAHRPPSPLRVGWEMLKTTAVVAVLAPLVFALGAVGLIVLGGMPVALAMLLLLGAAVWYLARIAGSVTPRA